MNRLYLLRKTAEFIAFVFKRLDYILYHHSFDAVIHFAGYKAVGESVEKPLEYYRNNLDSTLTLCEAMRKHGVKRIVFSSSATVYGMSDEMPVSYTHLDVYKRQAL